MVQGKRAKGREKVEVAKREKGYMVCKQCCPTLMYQVFHSPLITHCWTPAAYSQTESASQCFTDMLNEHQRTCLDTRPSA